MFVGRRKHAHRAGLLAAVTVASVLIAVSPAPAAADPPAGGMTGAQLTNAFTSYGDTSGRWSGGDSTASVLLPDGRVVWLFSDTMLGTVNADHTRPPTSPMVNNSMVVQDGAALTTTLHGGTTTAPLALVRPTATDQYYWVGDATVEGGALKVLYNSYRRTGGGALAFELTGTALATFALPALTLSGVVTLPLGSSIAWGSSILEDGAHTYIYGSEYVAADGMRFARLARVPAGGLSGPWEFWNGTGWSAASANSARLPLSGVGTAFGVQRVGSQYVVVTVEGNLTFNSQVVAYTSTSPAGPFTGPVDLFTAPEPGAAGGQGVITYDARVHPHLAPAGKLLVSYNVNSLNADDLYDDARIYRPRFVDVTWPPPQPNPATLPAAPTGLTATGDPTGTVTLSWAAPSGSGLTYAVYGRDVTAGQTHLIRVAQPTTTSAAIGGLKTQHTYEFRVTARNAAGEGPASAIQTLTVVISPPPAPTGLTATPGTDGTVTLTWSPVPYAWRYDVSLRDVTAGQTDFEPYSDLTPADTTATVTSLTNAHEYEFVVTASHGGGESPRSVAVRATVTYAPPGAPTGLTATPSSDGTIRLAWTGPTTVYYWVQQRDITAGEASFTQLPLPATCCELNAGLLAHGHEYEFRVLATNQGGDSPPSNLIRATATYPATAPPGTLAGVAGSGEVALTWGASATPGAWYWVYQRDVTAGETVFTRLPLPVSTCCALTAGFLTDGHTYEFKVTAIGPAGESAASSNLVQATPRAPLPGQVTGLTATPLTDGGIRLAWTAPTGLWYWIYQRDVTAGATEFTKLAYPVTNCCAFTGGLLTHQHVYEFKVAAINSTGEGPASAVVQATAFYNPPPAPTNLQAVAAGDGSVDLDWTGPGPSLYYWIYIRDVTAGQTTFTRSAFPTTATSHRWGSLVHGHQYQFKVSAQNSGGEGPATAAVTVTATGGLPQPPSNLSATPGNGQVTLNWTASPSPNVYYWVEMRPAGGAWQRLQFPLSTCCTHTVTLLTNGTTYEFRLRANNASGDSAASNVASARPMPPFPQAPSGLTATAGDRRATLHWTASPTSGVYYWIETRPVGAPGWRRLELPVTTCCTHTVSLLDNGTTYEFRLRATNLSGDSSPSNVASTRPMPPFPQPPTNLAATASGDTAARLTWTASPTGPVYYWIYYRLSTETGWTKAQYPLATCCTFTLSLLMPGRTYAFKLRAENLSGVSADSNVATVTLPHFAPGVPGNVRAVPSEFNSEVRVSWSPASLATSYAVEVRTCGSNQWRTVKILITNTQYSYPYAAGCHYYRVVADRYGKYGATSSGNTLAFGTYDDYPWKPGVWPFDKFNFRRHQCTSFVASRVEKYRIPPGTFQGYNYLNAENWDNAAATYGQPVFSTAAVGAIAQWEGNVGHVAWVAGIDGSAIIIEEYNFTNSEAYSRRRLLASDPNHYLTIGTPRVT